MGKSILILNGSPRKSGNTSALVKAFIQGAEKGGHQVTEFFLEHMTINSCKGCYGGGKDKARPCVQNDDMNKIYHAFDEADVIVLASPLYFWNISGQLKTCVDRLFALAERNDDYSYPVKDCALLMAAEGNDFEEIIYWYDRLLNHIGWNNIGKILCGGVAAIGDIDGRNELNAAQRLGEMLC